MDFECLVVFYKTLDKLAHDVRASPLLMRGDEFKQELIALVWLLLQLGYNINCLIAFSRSP